MHISRTSLEGAFDHIPISVIDYQYFPLMIESVKPEAVILSFVVFCYEFARNSVY